MPSKMEELVNAYESTYSHGDLSFVPPEHELINDELKVKLRSIYEKMKDLNCDWWLAVVGVEGAGKTTLVTGILYEWSKIIGVPFLEMIEGNMAFDEMDALHIFDEFSKQRKRGNMKKYYPIWFDEAANTWQNRDSKSAFRSLFLKYANSMRVFNRLVVLCSTEFKQLDVVIREHRLKSLINIEKQGVYHYYNWEQLKVLNQRNEGKRDQNMWWTCTNYEFHGWFKHCESIEKIITEFKLRFFDRLDMLCKTLYANSLLKSLKQRIAMDELEREEEDDIKEIKHDDDTDVIEVKK